MIYKQQFKSRVTECSTTLTVIENACDDVKMSVRLKKVLKTILKVGNQMNDGEDNLGFTLDSLLKLQSAKAFDKKTSILQYVIMLIYRNDEKCLGFPDELSHCAEASRLTLGEEYLFGLFILFFFFFRDSLCVILCVSCLYIYLYVFLFVFDIFYTYTYTNILYTHSVSLFLTHTRILTHTHTHAYS